MRKIAERVSASAIVKLVEDDDGKKYFQSQAFSSHPWKNRDYAPRLEQASPEEIADFLQDVEKDQLADITRQKEEQAKEEKNQVRQEWINSLPDEIGKFMIDKEYGMVLDEYGNRLFHLPEPIEYLETWIQASMAEAIECGAFE